MTDYFARLKSDTPTRLWVNNPTAAEVDAALAHGAVGCTTNPTFAANLLRRQPEYVRPIVASMLETDPSADDEDVARRVQQQLVRPVAERFHESYSRSEGLEGYVSLQGSPRGDDDVDGIVEEAHDARRIGPNVVPKIPGTTAGLAAVEVLIPEGCPVIVTEVFSLAQLIETNERYLKVVGQKEPRPPLFISPITGIFGDHLRVVAAQTGMSVEQEVLAWVGVAFGRSCQRIIEERQYPATLLFGGARTSCDFTGLVGARSATTVNYSTVEEILQIDPVVEDTVHQPCPTNLEQTLQEEFDDFNRALGPNGITLEDFAGFGPVKHFHDGFEAGWELLHETIREMRGNAVTSPASQGGSQ